MYTASITSIFGKKSRISFQILWLSHNICTCQANQHRNTYLGIQMNAKEVDSIKSSVIKSGQIIIID